ncbi:hypothetical protein [Mucilaginibacter sp.]|uniref:hypothetical protein n=1 Tax=Mucilaginibacter sp. TaxID=1882438 RepID=UPI003D0BFA28
MKKQFNILLLTAVASLMLFSACHKAEDAKISPRLVVASNPITSDTLSGSVNGTLLSGKTYYFASNITVNGGDTLKMQAGVTLIALGNGLTWQTAPEIIVHGTFISLGTQAQPNYITVSNAATLHAQANAQNYTNVFQGWWGGIFAEPGPVTAKDPTPAGGDVVIKWTHLEFAGGPSGPSDDAAVYSPQGSPRWTIYFANIKKNFVLEDSWVFGSRDDAMRLAGGHVNIMRNTYELDGVAAGEACNIKSGTVGDVAYNVIIGAATNAFKISDAGTTGIQCNINCYNNTIVSCGWRQSSTSGHGGSIDVEKAAKSHIYNNMIINCDVGLRILTTADTANTKFNNQLFYGYNQAIVNTFYALDGENKGNVKLQQKSGDILSTTPQANNPMFSFFDVNAYNYTTYPAPTTANKQTPLITMAGASSFHITSTSPAYGKGTTTASPPYNNVTTTGAYAPIVTPPGVDLGAYQSNGSGNQH